MFTSSIKREAFSRRSCAKTGKEMYVQSFCFAYKIYCFFFFLTFSLPSASLMSLMTLLSTTTVLFRTTFTRTIKLNPLLKLFLGSNLSHTKFRLILSLFRQQEKFQLLLRFLRHFRHPSWHFFISKCRIFLNLLFLLFL